MERWLFERGKNKIDSVDCVLGPRKVAFVESCSLVEVLLIFTGNMWDFECCDKLSLWEKWLLDTKNVGENALPLCNEHG